MPCRSVFVPTHPPYIHTAAPCGVVRINDATRHMGQHPRCNPHCCPASVPGQVCHGHQCGATPSLVTTGTHRLYMQAPVVSLSGAYIYRPCFCGVPAACSGRQGIAGGYGPFVPYPSAMPCLSVFVPTHPPYIHAAASCGVVRINDATRHTGQHPPR